MAASYDPRADLPASDTVPGWLLRETFAVQYNPNCPKPWLVRLVGFHSGGLDNRSYYGKPGTRDALGFGKTCEEAALAAKAIVDGQHQAFLEQMARDQVERRAFATTRCSTSSASSAS